MFSPSAFRELVSGRQTGPAADALRGLLSLAEFPYTVVTTLRNRRFDRRQATIHQVDVPVISVGNLTLGGTGKTPLVEWIACRLRQRNVRLAIVSRGYGAAEGARNDEALELELALPEVPHLQNPDRVAAAQRAIDQHDSQLLLLDDGFQHRRLARDLDVVLLDATEPFGYDHVFPRGTLREPLVGLARAHVVMLSRADLLDDPSRTAIRHRVAQIAPQAAWCEVVHRPQALISATGDTTPLAVLTNRRVAAFCGIGNPAGFRHTLATLGAEVIAWREFPDHHSYTRGDVNSLATWAAAADLVVCTRKDLVKLGVNSLGSVPLHALGIQVEFLTGEQSLDAHVADIVARIDVARIDSASGAT